jgi:glucose uptake protein
MPGTSFALLTILAWGTWLAPSQNVKMKSQRLKTFYVTLANLLVAFTAAAALGFRGLTWSMFLLPFVGGCVWTLSAVCALLGTSRLGMAKAVGIWAPLNIIFSFFWGMVLFGELVQSGAENLLLGFFSVLMIIAGILLIVMSGGDKRALKSSQGKELKVGLLGALGAGALWGSYFVPIRLSQASLWVTAFPMALGMTVMGTVLVVLSRSVIALEKRGDYARLMITGLLWSTGNYASLLTMEYLGTAKGFTLAQLNVVVNAVLGIFIFKNPPPRSRAALAIFAGILLALLGSIVLGNLK